jgi:hypothetical protein
MKMTYFVNKWANKAIEEYKMNGDLASLVNEHFMLAFDKGAEMIKEIEKVELAAKYNDLEEDEIQEMLIEKVQEKIDSLMDGVEIEEAPEVEQEPVRVEEAPRLTVAEIKGQLKGWILNGQIPTGKTVSYIWKGKDIGASEMKYTFLQGLDFENQIVVFGKSERDAWNQLYRILMTTHDSRLESSDEVETVKDLADNAIEFSKRNVSPEVAMEDRNNITLVTTPQAQFALIIGKRYTVHYKDVQGEYELANVLYLGHSVEKDLLFFGISFEEILHTDPLKITALWIDLQLEH